MIQLLTYSNTLSWFNYKVMVTFDYNITMNVIISFHYQV